MKLGIMQPYFFPYIGYFQLIKAVDKLVFYDDVNFIKNGWINRNRILINNQASYITVQLKDASSFKPINCIKFTDNRGKLKKTIEQAYKRAPYFNGVWPVIDASLDLRTEYVSELAMHSIEMVARYLNLDTYFEISSESYAEIKSLKRTDRLKEICRVNNASQYINPIGGAKLYEKDDFASSGIALWFLKSKEIKYRQNGGEFVPSLSVIDAMMFNSLEEISQLLDKYELV